MMWHDDCQTLLALDLPGVDSASLLSISLVAMPRGGVSLLKPIVLPVGIRSNLKRLLNINLSRLRFRSAIPWLKAG